MLDSWQAKRPVQTDKGWEFVFYFRRAEREGFPEWLCWTGTSIMLKVTNTGKVHVEGLQSEQQAGNFCPHHCLLILTEYSRAEAYQLYEMLVRAFTLPSDLSYWNDLFTPIEASTLTAR
jgi:hypothetical protein